MKKGEIKDGLSVDGFSMKNKDSKFVGLFNFHQKRIEKGIISDKGKEYFTEFDYVKKEMLRKRTFEGIRLMIIGNRYFKFNNKIILIRKKLIKNRDVGKTTLKRRLMGVSDQVENINAHKLVQKDKTEEDMTHGVDISTWRIDQMMFSLWDFAGKK